MRTAHCVWCARPATADRSEIIGGEMVPSEAGWFCARCGHSTTLLVICAGIALKRQQIGGRRQVVAVVYGGHAGSVDRDAVLASARAALADWPDQIATVEIVEDDPTTVGRQRETMAAARAGARGAGAHLARNARRN